MDLPKPVERSWNELVPVTRDLWCWKFSDRSSELLQRDRGPSRRTRVTGRSHHLHARGSGSLRSRFPRSASQVGAPRPASMHEGSWADNVNSFGPHRRLVGCGALEEEPEGVFTARALSRWRTACASSAPLKSAPSTAAESMFACASVALPSRAP